MPEPSASPHRLFSRRALLGGAAAGAAAVAGWQLLPDRSVELGPPAGYADITDPRWAGGAVEGSSASNNALPALQAALSSGRPVYAPPGIWNCPGQLFVTGDGQHLHLAEGAFLQKDSAIPSGWGSGFITNGPTMREVKVAGFTITGAGTMGFRDATKTGAMVAIYGDDQTYTDFTIDGWGDGIAFLLAGDRIRMKGVRTLHPLPATGNGGIRYAAGSDFVAEDCHIDSGDDSLQAVPIQKTLEHPFRDQDIDGVRYTRCTGSSTDARFYAVVLSNYAGTEQMQASVRNVTFDDCHGYGGNRGAMIRNDISTGDVDGVTFRDCTLDQSQAGGTEQDIFLDRSPDSGIGAVRNITFDGFGIVSPRSTALAISGLVQDVTITGSSFTASSAAGRILDLGNADGIVITGSLFTGGGSLNVISAGLGNTTTQGLQIQGCRLLDIPTSAGYIAVNLNAAPAARIESTAFVGGGRDSHCVRMGPASDGVVIEGNDVTDHPGTSYWVDESQRQDAQIRNNRTQR